MEHVCLVCVGLFLLMKPIRTSGLEIAMQSFNAMLQKMELLEKRIEHLEDKNTKLENRIANLEDINTKLENRNAHLEDENRKLELIEKLFEGEDGDVDMVNKVKQLDNHIKAPVQHNGNTNVRETIHKELENIQLVTKPKAPSNVSGLINTIEMQTTNTVKRQSTPRVAFCAGQSAMHVNNLGIHQTIVFDQIFTNVGNAYSGSTGIFRVPVSGHYVMSLVYNAGVKTSDNQRYLEVVENGVKLADVLLDSSSSYFASATKVDLSSQTGSEVWVRTTSYGTSTDVHGNLHSMLTGWLLYHD